MTKANTTSRTLYDPKFYLKGANAGTSFELRKKLDLTQAQVAKLTGYSIFAVRSWDQGTRSIPPGALEKLSKAVKAVKK